MILEYNYGESALRPPAAEICKTTVYLRRNYAETQREGTAFWTYDEAKLSHAEYSEYAKSPEFAEYVAALQTERDALADANSILTGGADIAQPAQAKAYRAKIEAAAQFAPDEIAIMEPSLYRRWTPDWTGKRGDIVRGDDGEGLYRAVHDILVPEENTIPPSEDEYGQKWHKIGNPADEWPEWIRPVPGVDPPAMKGDKCAHGGKRWISDEDNNFSEPGYHGWTEVIE